MNEITFDKICDKIEINCHSSIKLKGNKIIYIDPFKINEQTKDADFIFITHDHYDHFSEEDIIKIIKKDTIIIAPENSNIINQMQNVILVNPNQMYSINGIEFETVSAYNIDKPFHPKEKKWVGYVINFENKKYYIAGDTDLIEDIVNIKCDVAFLPVGGTYTMNYKEAATLANTIHPKLVIPIHYGSVVGKKKDASEFKKIVNKDILCEIIMKNPSGKV